ncbi:MAG: M20/M25/M40 family metallo-hydrolase [Acidobacteriota bacterium]
MLPRALRSPRLTIRTLLALALLAAATPCAAADGGDARETMVRAPDPVRWLQTYLAIDTVHRPPDDGSGGGGPGEAEAVDFLADLLAEAGIASERWTSPAGHISLYARLPATVAPGGEALVLMHHLDVVPADATRWRHPPFDGRIHRGHIWGRGAIDVKSLGIAHVAALVDLVRSGAPRHRDIVLLAVADEERGGNGGTGWLVEAKADRLADVAGVLNEGGSNRVIGQQLMWWGIEIAQKRPLWLRLSARGRGGHASMVAPDSATHALLRALARLVERPLAPRIGPVAQRVLDAAAPLEGTEHLLAALEARLVREPERAVRQLPPSWPPLLLDTVQVTQLDASHSPNSIATEATARVDVRLLPDTDTDRYLDDLRATLGRRIEIEIVLEAPQAAPSPVDHPVYRMLARVLGVRGPVVPTMISGDTDSRYFRERGIPTYGIAPFVMPGGAMRGVHGPDESIAVDLFLRGCVTMRRMVEAWVAEPIAPSDADIAAASDD